MIEVKFRDNDIIEQFKATKVKIKGNKVILKRWVFPVSTLKGSDISWIKKVDKEDTTYTDCKGNILM